MRCRRMLWEGVSIVWKPRSPHWRVLSPPWYRHPGLSRFHCPPSWLYLRRRLQLPCSLWVMVWRRQATLTLGLLPMGVHFGRAQTRQVQWRLRL